MQEGWPGKTCLFKKGTIEMYSRYICHILPAINATLSYCIKLSGCTNRVRGIIILGTS